MLNQREGMARRGFLRAAAAAAAPPLVAETTTARADSAPPNPAEHDAPMWLAPDHFIFSRGWIGSSPIGLMLLDTGGVGLGVVLTGDQASAAGIVPDYSDPGTYLGVPGYPCEASELCLGQVTQHDIPGAVGPSQAPANFGFADLGTLSHEFFRALSVTFSRHFSGTWSSPLESKKLNPEPISRTVAG